MTLALPAGPFCTVNVAARRDLLESSRPCAQVAETSTSAQFTVPAQPLAFGEHLRLVGSAPKLGGWDPEAGLALEWAEGDNWSAEASLPAGVVEFKVLRGLLLHIFLYVIYQYSLGLLCRIHR